MLGSLSMYWAVQIHPIKGLIHHLLFELHLFIRAHVLQQISETISFRFQFNGKHSDTVLLLIQIRVMLWRLV